MLGADEVVDYKKQEFEDVLRNYNAVLGTVRGNALEKSLQILKPNGTIVSLIGPPDAAFARARVMNFFMVAVFGYLQAGRIRPVIDKIFPFEQAKEGKRCSGPTYAGMS